MIKKVLVREQIDQVLQLFITSKTRRKIVTLFSKYPEYNAHVRGIAKVIREDPGNVQRELAKLEKAGYLSAKKEGNTKLYSANPDFIIFRELQGIVLKTDRRKR